MIGLYVHIPFCKRKCPYCDFYSIKHEDLLEEDYINAVIFDMQSYKGKNLTADTLYFGGGTPSIIKPENIKRIIDTARNIFSLNGEITMEANPNSITKDKLIFLKKAGINRISFGFQSTNEAELKALGRLHNKQEAISAIALANEALIKNISVDIMLGTPYQTNQSIIETLEIITSLPISHISAYMLKVEEKTPYYGSDILNFCCDEDTLSDIYLETISILEQKGFMQYEISNFARTGFESRHNLKYWQCEEYLGFGASAHSFFNNSRYCNTSDIFSYIENKDKNIIITDENAGGLDEYVIMGLRTTRGIDLSYVKACLGEDYSLFYEKLEKYCSLSFGRISNNSFVLSKTGFLLSNTILCNLLEIVELH